MPDDTLPPSPESFDDPDHHLWRNGRLWWIAFTVHLPNWTKERVRLSLATDDIEVARRRRDQILASYPDVRGCSVSLRPSPRSRRNGRCRDGVSRMQALSGAQA